jgi:hypothetical protein
MRVQFAGTVLSLVVAMSGCCHCPPQQAAGPTTATVRERDRREGEAVNPLGAAHLPVVTTTTGNFHGCPPEGDGGDPYLNQLKNRDIAPQTYKDMTVRELLDDEPEDAIAMGRKHRDKWEQEAVDEVSRLESKGARVEGFLLRVKKEGPESCNCHSADLVDHHMWLAANADDVRAESVVVEVSPRMLATPRHPNWTGPALQSLAKQQLKVRISGWIMWDAEHPEQVGNTRGTLWEIHPIHRIEFFKDGQWTDLDVATP